MARMRVCAKPGCPTLSPNRRCGEHASAYEQGRGRRQARGYDTAHERERERWARSVQLGKVNCARCDQPILLGQAWHLDHTDDRTGYLGPSHASCNTSAGGRAAHQT